MQLRSSVTGQKANLDIRIVSWYVEIVRAAIAGTPNAGWNS
jgi:hypothetical protein